MDAIGTGPAGMGDAPTPYGQSTALLVEEASEIVKAVAKSQRFGHDSPGGRRGDGPTPRAELSAEAGDMLSAIAIAVALGLIDREAMAAQCAAKYDLLTDQANLDNMGRPLGPPVDARSREVHAPPGSRFAGPLTVSGRPRGD